MSDADLKIERLREANHIRPVDDQKIPFWWMERVCWATRGWGYSDAYAGMRKLSSQYDCSYLMFDHCGECRDIGDGWAWWQPAPSAFVTEPYVDYDDPAVWRWAGGIAETLGVHFRILPECYSWWCPGSTVRIEFAPCVHRQVCPRCKSRLQLRDAGRARRRTRSRRMYY